MPSRFTRPIVLTLLAVLAASSSRAQSPDPPDIVPDDSAAQWVVDRFAGNSTAGPVFLQGPAREAGGLGRCGACPLPDGRVLIPFKEGIAEVDRDGALRLLIEGQFLFPTTGQVTASVMAHNVADRRIYVAGPNCIRRLIERNDGPWGVELVAGILKRPGALDGPAHQATFGRIDSIIINGRGQIIVLEDNQRLRLIEQGQVSTITAAMRAGPAIDGPLDKARFNLIGLGGNVCLGEDDDTLYVSDHWNFAVRKIDLKTRTVSTVAGMPKPAKQDARGAKRFNRNSDGPALTLASFNSGCAYVCYDPVHKSLWCGGPDEHRFRWLKGDQVLTVIGVKGQRDKSFAIDAVGTPADKVLLSWNAVVAVDAQGRAYLSCSEHPSGLWVAYPRKEARP